MFVIYNEKKNRIPIKIWLEDISKIEHGCLEQAINLSNLSFAYHHVAIMPDTHQGYGMPIGGVIATENVVIPNAVGVDIGCGMSAVKTSLTEIDTYTLKKIIGEIRKVIPVGFSHQKERQDKNLMPNEDNINYIIEREYSSALYQLGTLGGGNHFIEIQKGSDGHIWIMVHSGSRNIGYKVADYYNKLAKELNLKWNSNVPPKFDLAFLPLNSEEGQMYLKEMNYCLDFACANRSLMMENIINVFYRILKIQKIFAEDQHSIINIHHNYASMENHFGKNVMVHRKGATLAREGTIGIIPGSQGTKSYIVKGKGNPESFMSCSHGAGRLMSRKKAKVNLSLKDEINLMDSQGIIHGIRCKGDLDEAPSAYKNIDSVMKNQKDLVEILVELKPLAVMKG